MARNRQIFVCLVVATLLTGCFKKPELLHDRVESLEDLDPIYVAYLRTGPADRWAPDIESCFSNEPGIEWYSTAETYRILQEKQISAANLENIRSFPPLQALANYDFLMVTLPRANGVMLRSFRFKQEKIVESFLPADQFTCDVLYKSLNLVKIISLPDQGYIFVNRRYQGRSPRWVQMPEGKNRVRVEGTSVVIGEAKVIQSPDTPKKTFVTLRGEDTQSQPSDPQKMDGERLPDKLGMATVTLVGLAIAVAAAIIPILLLF